MNSEDLVKFEINQFRKGWGKNICFDNLSDENVDQCLAHALSDALNQGARRNKVKYKPSIQNLLEENRQVFIDIALNRITIKTQQEYKDIFNYIKEKFFNSLRNNNLGALATFGFAQKFISMSFKYLFCFEDTKRENLKYCYLPLDQYTIDWYKTIGNESTVNRFKNIHFAWSIIDEKLFFEIQDDIDSKLMNNLEYQVNCKDRNKKVILPNNKLEVEFIVWMQQRLNDIYNNSLLPVKDYYDRLGIHEL